MVEVVLIIHFMVILFFVFGFPIALYYNHRMFRIIHASGLAGVTVLMVLGIPCPLTIWEEILRENRLYGGSFIASWLNKIIYLEGIATEVVILLSVGFTILVASSFIWKPLKGIDGKKNH